MNDEFIKKAAEVIISKLLADMSTIIEAGGQADTMVFLVKGELGVVIPLHFSNDVEKHEIFSRVNFAMRMQKPDFGVFVSESWLSIHRLENNQEIIDVPRSIQDYPGRKECLVFVVQYDNGGFMKTYEIDRSEDIPQLKPLMQDEGSTMFMQVEPFRGVFEDQSSINSNTIH